MRLFELFHISDDWFTRSTLSSEQTHDFFSQKHFLIANLNYPLLDTVIMRAIEIKIIG